MTKGMDTLPDELRAAMSGAGDFTTRLTIGCDAAELQALADHAAEERLEFTHVVLAQGRRPVSQPMITLRAGSAGLDEVWSAAGDTVSALGEAGFRVARVKVAAAPWNPGVPLTDAEAVALPDGTGFEHHVTLLLPARFRGVTRLVAAVGPHAAHLSRNARRIRPDGRQERIVTQRCRAAGADTAATRLAALTADLRAAGHRIAAIERGFVVHDSGESREARGLPG